jgi:putative redox protein
MKATVRWKENMNFVGMPDSGFPIPMDSDAYFGGTKNGVRPMEMIALGLAGCTAMDVLSVLQKKRQNITSFEVKVDAPRSGDHPQVFTSAVFNYVVTGKNVDDVQWNSHSQNIVPCRKCLKGHSRWSCAMRFMKMKGMETGE